MEVEPKKGTEEREGGGAAEGREAVCPPPSPDSRSPSSRRSSDRDVSPSGDVAGAEKEKEEEEKKMPSPEKKKMSLRRVWAGIAKNRYQEAGEGAGGKAGSFSKLLHRVTRRTNKGEGGSKTPEEAGEGTGTGTGTGSGGGRTCKTLGRLVDYMGASKAHKKGGTPSPEAAAAAAEASGGKKTTMTLGRRIGASLSGHRRVEETATATAPAPAPAPPSV